MSWNRNMRTESGIFRDTEKESRSYGSFSVYCYGGRCCADSRLRGHLKYIYAAIRRQNGG